MQTLEQPETLQEGMIEGIRIRRLTRFADARGWLSELFRADELPAEYVPAMAYISETRPGVARGPHEHVDQADLFAFLGPGDFRVYLWDARANSETFGRKYTVVAGASNPLTIVIPPGVVHAYKNISDGPGIVINLPNRLYRGPGKQEAIDEIRHEDDPGSPYQLD